MAISAFDSTITQDQYHNVCPRHPAAVAIVTLSSDAAPVRFTATSFTSLSAEPPLVCFNITHTSSSIAAVRTTESLVIHLLSQNQRELAQTFSRNAAYRFSDPESWSRLETGEPVLRGVPTWLRATLCQLIPARSEEHTSELQSR